MKIWGEVGSRRVKQGRLVRVYLLFTVNLVFWKWKPG